MVFSCHILRPTHSLLLFLTLSGTLYAQSAEDIRQRTSALVPALGETHDIKMLNIAGPSLHSLPIDKAIYTTQMEFVEKTKRKNNLENKVKFSVVLTLFVFETTEDRDWALKSFFRSFFDAGSLRPGRDVKTLTGLSPGIVCINSHSISILTIPCAQYDALAFRDWRKMLLTYFGEEASTVVDIDGCDGPIVWTKNPPHPSDRRWK